MSSRLPLLVKDWTYLQICSSHTTFLAHGVSGTVLIRTLKIRAALISYYFLYIMIEARGLQPNK